MKRIFNLLILLLVLCGSLNSVVFADDLLKRVYCDEQNFSVVIPADNTADWDDEVGLRVSLENPGYVPYLGIYRRTEKLNDPVNFLNNVYREYMEEQYNNNVATNPCMEYNIGGKVLYTASYHYDVYGIKLCVTKMIEVRDDGDVEYMAKYIEGNEEETLAVLDFVMRNYQPYGDGAGNESLQKEVLDPMNISETEINTENKTYFIRIQDTDKIISDGFFTVSLYEWNEYPAEKVGALDPGDKVRINGEVYTVEYFLPYYNGFLEIVPREAFYGDVAFQKVDDFYTVMVNDWYPVSFLADYKVTMPLPDDFSYVSINNEENKSVVYDADSFVEQLIQTDAEHVFNQYNTLLTFHDGLIDSVVHSETIFGPEG